MRRWVVRGVVAAAAASACMGGTAWAQNREKAWELYPYVGFIQFEKRANLKDRSSAGLNFAYHWTKYDEVEFGFGGASTKDTSGVVSADLITARANYIRNLFLQHRGKVVLFGTAGAGILNFSTFGNSTLATVGDETDLVYNYGLGMRFFGGRRAGFRIDARRAHYDTHNTGSDTYTEVTVGVTLILGGA
jgi:Outer membrane protein beta-barrel domain